MASDRLANLDLDGDFDPEAYEQQLQSAFDDSYYDEEADLGPDGKPIKPKFDSDDELDGFNYGAEDDEAADAADAEEQDDEDEAARKKSAKPKGKAKGDDKGADSNGDTTKKSKADKVKTPDASALAAATMDADAPLSNRQVR